MTEPDFDPAQAFLIKRKMSLFKALSRRKYAESRATYKRGQRLTTPHALAIPSATTYFGQRQTVSSKSTTPDFCALRLGSSDGAPQAQQGSFWEHASYYSSPHTSLPMSLPPNVIRVKRKRVEESPVTFLRTPLSPCVTVVRRVYS